MIPKLHIENWQENTNWQTLAQVEQDLIISRALVCLYNDPLVKSSLVFRGGTALNKLFLKPAARYSEDLDFVQLKPEPIGPTIDRIRELLTPWLGNMRWKLTERSAKLIYPFDSIDGSKMKLKIEINTTEHFQILPLRYEDFIVNSKWFEGACKVVTYQLAELMATKLRALYQRRKGRDLFDVWYIFRQPNLLDIDQVLELFQKYCKKDGIQISSDLFKKNIELKGQDSSFRADMDVLLPLRMKWNFEKALDFLQDQVLSRF